MIPIKVKKNRFSRGETYYLPSRYEEITLDQYLVVKHHAESVGDLIAFLSKCPHKLDGEAFAPVLSWLTEPLDIKNFEPDPLLFDLKRKTYGQKLVACDALRKDPTMFGVAAVVDVYFPGQKSSRQPLGVTLPRYLAIVEQLEKILRVEQGNLRTEPTPEQLRAGISEFDKLGNFNQIDDLAMQLRMTYDDVLALEYIVVYQKLLKNKISSNFEKRYRAIIKQT